MELDGLPGALDRLVARGVLDREQAGAVLAEMAGPAPAPPGMRRLLGEMAGYLGASFVVGATLLFLGQEWEALGRNGRFGVLAAMAVVLAGAGILVRLRLETEDDDVRRRLSSTLLTGAAFAAAVATYVILEPPGDTAARAAAAVGLVAVVSGYLVCRSALGLLGVAVGAYTLYGTVLDVADALHQVPLGAGAMVLGVGWAVLAWLRLVTERRLALAIAVTSGLFGAQVTLIDARSGAVAYVLTGLVAAACFVAYARLREWVLLVGGVIGATLLVPEFLWDVTDGSLGAAGVLLVAGVTLLGGSLAGLRIRRTPPPAVPASTQEDGS